MPAATLLDPVLLEYAARRAYQAVRAYRRVLGEPPPPPWEDAPIGQKKQIYAEVRFWAQHPQAPLETAYEQCFAQGDYGRLSEPQRTERAIVAATALATLGAER
ncbi:hypothetical protein [Meiothermus sp. Pnk-1]|uniref:hypothetical protein n=1 Tax=Meiothermus sp. Pnk-1 TaxID=873128 RepID=UPI000D7BF135|nr:hypothetical protein [Meiothermus sp. Pnk-1]PZA08308.1 hypothetical protein DNA98_04005 [Meiothermus sp. Pnk-1]